MNNIEKIRQEIERLYDGEAPKHDQQCEFEDGYFTGIATISKFIDSLPEEKPSEDLEEAAEMAARKIYPYEGGMKGLICENSIPIYKAGFIAGAEWQRK